MPLWHQMAHATAILSGIISLCTFEDLHPNVLSMSIHGTSVWMKDKTSMVSLQQCFGWNQYSHGTIGAYGAMGILVPNNLWRQCLNEGSLPAYAPNTLESAPPAPFVPGVSWCHYNLHTKCFGVGMAMATLVSLEPCTQKFQAWPTLVPEFGWKLTHPISLVPLELTHPVLWSQHAYIGHWCFWNFVPKVFKHDNMVPVFAWKLTHP